jgi:hypothetical protein
MIRFKRLALGTAILVLMTSVTAFAQGKGGGNKGQGGGAPKTTQAAKPTATKPTQAAKPAQSPKVQPAKTQAPVKSGGS